MPAIITSKFRLENAFNFKEAISTDSIYLAIGKSDNWNSLLTGAEVTPPQAVDTQIERNDFWQNAIALKKIDSSNVTHLVPRYNWSSGATDFTPWDDSDDTIYTKKFYCITSTFNVYKLISKAPTASGTGSTAPWKTSDQQAPYDYGDGYFWKYMYTLTAAEAAAYLTNLYMPVKTVVSGDTSESAASRLLYQTNCAADKGKIYRIVLQFAGSSGTYNTAPTVNIIGNGTGATAVAHLKTDGSKTIDYIEITNNGQNYDAAYVTFSSGDAIARVILSPGSGHGTDPVAELGGFYVVSRIILNGAEAGDFIVNGAEFRQVAMIKNPYDYNTTSVSTATTLSALKTLSLTTGSAGGLKPGDIITQPNGATAYVDAYTEDGTVIPTTKVVKYHQNDKTGYTAFTATGVITGNNGGGGTISSLGNPEVQKFSGEVLFVENRGAITRAASQLEDVRVILEF